MLCKASVQAAAIAAASAWLQPAGGLRFLASGAAATVSDGAAWQPATGDKSFLQTTNGSSQAIPRAAKGKEGDMSKGLRQRIFGPERLERFIFSAMALVAVVLVIAHFFGLDRLVCWIIAGLLVSAVAAVVGVVWGIGAFFLALVSGILFLCAVAGILACVGGCLKGPDLVGVEENFGGDRHHEDGTIAAGLVGFVGTLLCMFAIFIAYDIYLGGRLTRKPEDP